MKYECAHHKLPQKFTKFGSSRLPVNDQGELFWHMGSWGTDLDRYHQIGIVSSAFQEWQRYFIPWEFKSTRNEEQAQWHVHWARKNKITLPDGSVLDTKERGLFDFVNNPDTLAVEFASPNLLCIINDDHNYSLDADGPNAIDLYTVLVHELGHGLLFGHTDEAAVKEQKKKGKIPIMGAYYDKRAVITEDEEAGIRKHHGAHLREFANHPTIIRIQQVFSPIPDPAPMREKPGCLGKLFGK